MLLDENLNIDSIKREFEFIILNCSDTFKKPIKKQIQRNIGLLTSV